MFTINIDQSFRKQISQAKQKLHQTHHQIFNKAVEDINRITERYKGVKVSPESDELHWGIQCNHTTTTRCGKC